MYTQHPILTEKHRIVDIFADLLKRKTEISHGPKYSDPLLCDTHIFNSGAVHFFLIILEMVLHLHLSPAVFDYTDWT